MLNWRNPTAYPNSHLTNAMVPLGLPSPSAKIYSMSQMIDEKSLMDEFADWTTSGRWKDVKELFEFWIRTLDKNGKPNKPSVDLYNYYLMVGGSMVEFLDLVAQMESFGLSPNTASYNLVLKAMHRAQEDEAAQKLLERNGIKILILVFSSMKLSCVYCAHRLTDKNRSCGLTLTGFL